MYENSYKQASTLADQIRRAAVQPEEGTTQTLNGFIQRRRKDSGLAKGLKESSPESKPDPNLMAIDQTKIIMDYLTSLRNQSEEMGLSPLTGDVGKAAKALAMVESGGDYGAKGPVIEKGFYKGDRAYGKYQVMGKNIPVWTQKALGHSLTIEQFLADPRAQDAVVKYQLQKSYDKFGTWEDAASVWFTGQPYSKGKGRDDGYIDGKEYVSRFRKYFGEL